MEDERLQAWGYRLDEADPEVAVLRRGDDSFVAAFSAWGATRASIRSAAEEDLARDRQARTAERRVNA